MVDFVRLAATADRLTRANGRAFTMIRQSKTDADSNKPWGAVTGAETTLDLNGVFVPPNTVRQFGLTALGQGTQIVDLVNKSEQIIITYPGENDLRQYQEVLDGGVRWGIVGLQVLRPATTYMLAFIGVRR